MFLGQVTLIEVESCVLQGWNGFQAEMFDVFQVLLSTDSPLFPHRDRKKSVSLPQQLRFTAVSCARHSPKLSFTATFNITFSPTTRKKLSAVQCSSAVQQCSAAVQCQSCLVLSGPVQHGPAIHAWSRGFRNHTEKDGLNYSSLSGGTAVKFKEM